MSVSTTIRAVKFAIEQFKWNNRILQHLVQNFLQLTDLLELEIVAASPTNKDDPQQQGNKLKLFDVWFSYLVGIRDEYNLVYYGVLIPQYHEDRNYCFIHVRHGLDEVNSGNKFLKLSCSHDGLRFLFNEGNNKRCEDELLMMDNLLRPEFDYVAIEFVEILEQCERSMLHALRTAGFTLLNKNMPHVHPYVQRNEELTIRSDNKACTDRTFSGTLCRERADDDSSKVFPVKVLGLKFDSYESVVLSTKNMEPPLLQPSASKRLLSSSSSSTSSSLSPETDACDGNNSFKRLKRLSGAGGKRTLSPVDVLNEQL